MYSVSSGVLLDEDTSLITGAQSSPLIMSSIGEILYPATIASRKNSVPRVEPGLVVVDLPRQCWRKMVLPV